MLNAMPQSMRWYHPRPWGGVATSAPEGRPGPTLTLCVHHPQQNPSAAAATERYLAWRHGSGRLTTAVLIWMATFWVAVWARPSLGWAGAMLIVGAGLLCAGLVDVGMARRRRPDGELANVRSMDCKVRPAWTRVWGADAPAIVEPPEVPVVIDRIDTVFALHADGRLDDAERDEAHWALWNSLETEPEGRSGGWAQLIRTCDLLVAAAAARTA